MPGYFKRFFAQKDEECQECGKELPTGSVIFTDTEEVYCEKCIEKINFEEEE